MSLGKSRQCAGSCLEYLALEIVHYYAQQRIAPPQAAIDAIGYRIGRQLVERYTASRPRLGEHLDIVKFICKEFWHELFHKQVDNLRTNHRGTYVLKDADFRWLKRLSMGPGRPEAGGPQELARDYLHLPCGIIRGALLHLGVDCTVTAEALPGAGATPVCDFTITIKAA